MRTHTPHAHLYIILNWNEDLPLPSIPASRSLRLRVEDVDQSGEPTVRHPSGFCSEPFTLSSVMRLGKSATWPAWTTTADGLLTATHLTAHAKKPWIGLRIGLQLVQIPRICTRNKLQHCTLSLVGADAGACSRT